MKKLLLALLVLVAAAACNKNVVYEESIAIDPEAWQVDSIAKFSFDITDTVPSYSVSFIVRNSGDYQYQNLWLFVRNIEPDLRSHNDTVQLMLADDLGNWVGSGIGSIYSATYEYQHKLRFPKPGTYQLYIQQGMRTDSLAGIHDIGLKITKRDGKK